MKSISLLICVLFVFLVACGGGSDNSSENSNDDSSDEPVYTSIFNFSSQITSNTEALIFDSSGEEYINGSAIDDEGNIYIAGSTTGDLITTNSGARDAFVAKLSPSGEILWTFQLTNSDLAMGMDASGIDVCQTAAVDSLGNIYCGGSTGSSLSEANGGSNDVFVMKLSPNGALTWIKQLGSTTIVPGGDTSMADTCLSMVVDSMDNIYCTGVTYSSLGEVNGGSGDIYLAKFTTLGALDWITQLGATTTPVGGNTSGLEQCQGLAVDSSDNFYCSGYTTNSFMETKGGAADGLAVKFSSTGSLVWAKQFGAVSVAGGSPAFDGLPQLSVDSDDDIYLAGFTNGSLYEVGGGSYDAVSVKLDSNGVVLWSVQLGLDTFPSGEAAEFDNFKAPSFVGARNAAIYPVVTEGELNGEAKTDTDSDIGYVVLDSEDGSIKSVTQIDQNLATLESGISSTESGQYMSLGKMDPSGNLILLATTTSSFIDSQRDEADVDSDMVVISCKASELKLD